MKAAEHKSAAISTVQKKSNTPFFDTEHASEQESPFFAPQEASGTDAFFQPATRPIIQTKLTVGQPNDKYEQEADTVADKVVQRLAKSDNTNHQSPITNHQSTPSVSEASTPIIQHKTEAPQEEKLDRKEENKEELAELQKSPVSAVGDDEGLQMKCAECEAEEDSGHVQMKASTEGGTFADDNIESLLNNSKNNGSPLPDDTRGSMESTIGADFSAVRVHTDSNAEQMNQGLNAQAFTHGSDVYFNSGKYNPSDREGGQLLAHELVHTVQQGASSPIEQAQKIETPNKQSIESTQTNETATQNMPAETQKSALAESAKVTQVAESAKGSDNAANSDIAFNRIPEKSAVEPNQSTSENSLSNAPTHPNTHNSGSSGSAMPMGADIAAGGAGNPEVTQSAPLDTTSSEGLLNSLTSRRATDFIRGMSESDSAVSTIQVQEKQTLSDSLPEIEQPTGLPTVEETALEANLPENTSTEAPILSSEISQNTEFGETPHPISSVPVVNLPTPRPATENPAGYGQGVRQLITQLPTSDESIITSAGPRPNIDLSGAADPSQNEVNQLQYTTQVSEEQDSAQQLTQQDFGENNIYPRVERETLTSNAEIAPPQGRAGESLSELPILSGDQYAAFDMSADGHMREQIDAQMATHEVEHERMVTDSARERQSSLDNIATETEQTRIEQQRIQSEARGEVADHRQTWQNENEQVRQSYATSSAETRQRTDEEINTQVETTNQSVETQLSEAENEAETERLRVESEAARQEREAAEQPEPSFWDRAASAISDFFDSLRDALNSLFDGLRAFVREVIDLAKQAVNALIDLARDAIVGLIQAFGEALKAFVNIALAAFPEIAARINSLIDQAVDYAVEQVNELAEALKEIASAILDALGAVLDTILAVYQAVYNAILDVLEFLTVGLLRILEGLANLAMGFAEMLPQFHGALLEEFLGTNITEPLPNVERTDEEIAANQSGELPAEMPEGLSVGTSEGSTEELSELATTTHLSDDQVALDPSVPIELDETLIEQIATMQSEGNLELGGSDNPVTTQQIQESVFEPTESGTTGTSLSDTSSVDSEPTAAPSEVGETNDSAETTGTDFSNMSDEQKLDYFIGQMSEQLQAPTTEDARDETPPEHDPSVPYEMKTNRLSVGTRLSFVGRQMMEGARIWWNQNSTMVYLAMIGILVGGAVIAFFTGGAGLIALIQLLLQIMMAYFIADAVLRIRGHISDFFSKSWEGQTREGGHSLARALAVIISEFLLEYILKGVGRVLKRIKNMLRATRLGRRVLGAAVHTRRLIGRGMRRVRRFVTNATRPLRNVVVRGRRFIIRGFNRLMARGARSLRELRDRILRHFGFRRIWFEFHGRRFELWAEFNSRVLLSTGEITDADDAGRVGSRGTFMDAAGRRRRGIVMDDTGNPFSRSLDDMTDAERRAIYQDLNQLDETTRRTRIHGGTPSERVSLRPEVRQTIFDRANTGRVDANGFPIFRDGKTQLDIPNYGTHYPATTPLGHPHPRAGQPVPTHLVGTPRADIGHRRGQDWASRLAEHRAAGRSRAEIIELENNANLYVLEERSSNRSRILD